MVTQSEIIKLFSYNQETGLLSRRSNPNKRVGAVTTHGYLQVRINGKYYPGHRLIWLYVYGSWPKHHIDHINGDRIDNRIGNLRDATRGENQKNQKLPIDNSTGVIGVSFSKKTSTYQSYICVDRKQNRLYGGEDFFEAICRRKSAERKYGFHENHGRTEKQKIGGVI